MNVPKRIDDVEVLWYSGLSPVQRERWTTPPTFDVVDTSRTSEIAEALSGALGQGDRQLEAAVENLEPGVLRRSADGPPPHAVAVVTLPGYLGYWLLALDDEGKTVDEWFGGETVDEALTWPTVDLDWTQP